MKTDTPPAAHAEESAFAKCATKALLLLAIAFAGIVGNAQAQVFPSKPVRLIVPAPPGGIADLMARVVGDKLSAQWQQPVIIDNKPGAQQMVGTALASRAVPDGYTVLLLIDSTLTMLPHAMKKLPYDPKAIVPVAMLANAPGILVASASFPANSVPEMIRLAKASPGKLTIGFSTFSTRVAAAQLASQAGINLVNVPYRGTPESTQGLLAGDITLAISVYSAVRSSPQLRVLATTGTKRSPVMPDVPTFEELGYPGFESGTQMGIAVPAGTPAQIVAKLQADVAAVMAMPEVQNKVRAMNLDLFLKNTAETTEMIRRDSERWEKVIQDAGLTLE